MSPKQNCKESSALEDKANPTKVLYGRAFRGKLSSVSSSQQIVCLKQPKPLNSGLTESSEKFEK